MRGQHVIIGGDDADIHRLAAADCGLVFTARGKAVREIATAQGRPVDARIPLPRDQVQIGGAARL